MKREVQEGVPHNWKDKYPLVVLNATYPPEIIPGRAVMQVSDSTLVGQDTVYKVVKPGSTAVAGGGIIGNYGNYPPPTPLPQGSKYLINTPAPIPIGGYGSATDFYPADSLIAHLPNAPVMNQEIGPETGTWSLSANGRGFIFLGGLSDGVARVAANDGSKAGDDFPLIRIFNNTNGALRLFGEIVGYGAALDPPPATFNRIPTFLSAKPKAGKLFAVLLNDVKQGEIGDAAPVGVVAVKIDFTEVGHEYAEAITDDYEKLASAAAGHAKIVWRENQNINGAGTLGLQWARVLLDPLAAIEDPWGVICQTITAATGNVGGPITPGKGLVTLYLPPTGPIGTPWQPGPTIACETSMPAESTVPKVVIIRKSRIDPDGVMIYRAIAQSCPDLPAGSSP